MGILGPSASSLAAVAGHVEHVYSVVEGAAPPPGTEEVSGSWQRSANKYGVDAVDGRAPRILTPGELMDFREALDKLIFSAQEEIDQLCQLVPDSWDIVVLLDN